VKRLGNVSMKFVGRSISICGGALPRTSGISDGFDRRPNPVKHILRTDILMRWPIVPIDMRGRHQVSKITTSDV
jgi:hypothetical protein